MEMETKETGGKLNAHQAISVLIQGVRIGQEKGAYTLEDAAIIMQAIQVFEAKEDKEVTKDTPEGNQSSPTEDENP